MIVYPSPNPIDDFAALTSLPDWIAADRIPHTRWTLRAIPCAYRSR